MHLTENKCLTFVRTVAITQTFTTALSTVPLSVLPWHHHCFGSCCTGDPTVNSV